MNILWIALISIFVLLEKVLPLGSQGGKLLGILMVATGVIMFLNK